MFAFLCLLLGSLFAPALSVSTLALHFCVGVESDPHLQGLFYFFFFFSSFLALSFFFFLSGCGI